jgi:hypothetical protein
LLHRYSTPDAEVACVESKRHEATIIPGTQQIFLNVQIMFFSNFLSMGTDRERSHGFFVHDHLPLFDDAVKSLNSEMFALALQFPTGASMCTYYGSMPPCSRNMELTEIIANAERCLTLL